MGRKQGVSVIIPVLNEVGNIQPLILRIDSTLRNLEIPYEILFIDDHSTDGTQKAIADIASKNPAVVQFEKQGKRGKAYSILEGVARSQHEIICMIDADLQYAPENIAPMLTLMEKMNSDVVITNRITHATGALRKLASFVFNYVFIKLLFGIEYDTQSGLKLFRKKVLENITVTPSPWSFDLEFIVRSLLKNYSIVSYDITFEARNSGDAKISMFKSSFELAKSSISLRFKVPALAVRKKYKNNIQHFAGMKDAA